MLQYEEQFETPPVSAARAFLLQPPSRLACLSYWRVLGALLASLSAEARTTVFSRAESAQPLASLPVSLAAASSVSGDLEFVDSHFHLDLLLRDVRLPSFQAAERRFMSSGTRETMVRGVANYVFPLFFSKIDSQMGENPRLVYTIGVHPKAVWGFEKAALAKLLVTLAGHLCRAQCVALGEVGLDFTKQVPRPLQKSVLRAMLPLVRTHGKALVLHTRADQRGLDSSAVDEVLGVLRELGLLRQSIHVHCWTYSWAVAERLLRVCPNASFGFSALVMSLDHVAEVARRFPIGRLLLETDSPFLCAPGVNSPNHPWNLPVHARYIAQLRNVPVSWLLGRADANAARIYRF